MAEPLVDILMPTYRPHAEHLRAAIESVLTQGESRWRLTIRDEPTDVNTKTIVEPYCIDERIRLSRNEHRLGIGGNWNRCLQDAEAPYVQFLFQDDTWKPDYLASAIKAFETHPRCGLISLGHTYTLEGETDLREHYRHVENTASQIAAGEHGGTAFLLRWMRKALRPNVIGEPSFVMLRRETVQRVGNFREDMQQLLDEEYWVRMLAAADWYRLPGNFGSFRVHADAASARNRAQRWKIAERFRLLGTALRIICCSPLWKPSRNGKTRY